MPTRRNTSIEAMRFLFICLLCPYHCPAVSTLIPGGCIAVEFFFILSGFFIYQSYRRHSEVGTIDFTLCKVRRFSVPMTLSLVLMMLLDRKQYIYLHDLSPDGIIDQYFSRLPEFLFMSGMQWTDVSMVNVTLWFVSILIIGGGVTYALLREYGENASSVIIPVLSLFGISYLLSFGDNGLSWRGAGGIPGLHCNLVRGLAEMGVGVMIACLYEAKHVAIGRRPHVLSLLSIIGLAGMLLIAMGHKNHDSLALFLVPMIILGCYTQQSWLSRLFRHRLWSWLGGLSMYMYFFHAFVSASYYIVAARMPQIELLPVSARLAGYLAACLFGGWLFKLACQKVSALLKI